MDIPSLGSASSLPSSRGCFPTSVCFLSLWQEFVQTHCSFVSISSCAGLKINVCILLELLAHSCRKIYLLGEKPIMFYKLVCIHTTNCTTFMRNFTSPLSGLPNVTGLIGFLSFIQGFLGRISAI